MHGDFKVELYHGITIEGPFKYLWLMHFVHDVFSLNMYRSLHTELLHYSQTCIGLDEKRGFQWSEVGFILFGVVYNCKSIIVMKLM